MITLHMYIVGSLVIITVIYRLGKLYVRSCVSVLTVCKTAWLYLVITKLQGICAQLFNIVTWTQSSIPLSVW